MEEGSPESSTALGSEYLLDEVIATGARGHVWRGRRRADGMPVAVKVVRGEYARDSDTVVRFLRQLRALRALEHPHLVRIHDLVAEADTLAIVMDLVEGENLRGLVRRGSLTHHQVITVLAQIADALAAMHAGGLVHQEVRPDKILVGWRDGTPFAQLTGSSLTDAVADPPRGELLVGAPAYVAPEVVAGRRPGPAVDVYALGISAYELLTGQRPFKADHTAGLLRAHLEVRPTQPHKLDPPIWDVVHACLAKDPAERPNAADLAARLAAFSGTELSETDQGNSDHVDWVGDAPTGRDALRRAAFIAVLGGLLRRVHMRDPHTSFAMHVDGPWGAGKSSLLRLLREALADDFLVVHFDAWRHRRVEPPWWALLTALRHDIARALPRRRRIWFWLRDAVVRARRGGAPYWLTLLFFLLGAVGVVALLAPAQLTSDSVSAAARSFGAIAGALALLWTGARAAGKMLLWDSARGARMFEQTHTDPMREVAEHFAWLLQRAPRPVVFFIEDLDRCPGKYVVELLEAAQTLVRDAPVTHAVGGTPAAHFVVAADGAWLRCSYEAAYEGFRDPVSEPGRPLGYLFLDKLFQLTVPVPSIDTSTKSAYLRQLLQLSDPQATEPRGPNAADSGKARSIAETVQLIKGSRSEEEILKILRDATPDAINEAIAAALHEFSNPAVQTATEHALEAYSPLLPPNPRSMKRFLNMYSVLRAARTAENNTVATAPLAAWTLLRVRWPGLADHLAVSPHAVVALAEGRSDDLPEHLAALATRPDVRATLTMPDGHLTPELLQACAGIPPEPNPRLRDDPEA